uniref:Putative GTP diphosphokinase RSH1, chloroplastic n=1 Tax=Auxenochlorella protothecoides TaxID=3075 RepID=A0A1D2ADF7_AUXPR
MRACQVHCAGAPSLGGIAARSRGWTPSRRPKARRCTDTLPRPPQGPSAHARGLGRQAPARQLRTRALDEYDDQVYSESCRTGAVSEAFLWEGRLAPLLTYLPPHEVVRVREALSLAYDAHAGQKRRSGEPYITHPVEVARILAELRMDHESLVAGLLHDTVEDCGDVVGLDEIGFHFGPGVRRIVEGETKFSKLPTRPAEAGEGGLGAAAALRPPGSSGGDSRAEDMRFLFLAMTEEVRIIIVKLADRLHNMRTMRSMPGPKQTRIARETLQVFAPLARLLGLYAVKEELEDLAFRYAWPERHLFTQRLVARLWREQAATLEAARDELASALAADPLIRGAGLGVDARARCRSLYSIWRKMEAEEQSVHGVNDVCQLVVVLSPGPGREDADRGTSDSLMCYHTLGLVHSMWIPIPGTFRDYIAQPKMNNYRALHTKVMPRHARTGGEKIDEAGEGPSPRLFSIDVQIRTAAMQHLAEYGVAVDCWQGAEVAQAPPSAEPAQPVADLASRLWPLWGWLGWAGAPAGERQGAAGGASGNGSRAGSGVPATNGSQATNGSPPTNGSRLSVSGAANGRQATTAARVAPWNGSSGSDAGALAWGGGSEAEGGGLMLQARLDAGAMSRRINWLNSIRQWQEEFLGTLTAMEFVQCVTDDLLGRGVFVFTPSGQIKRMPRGSTVVDFAYHIHTDVGNAMLAAKVNGKLVSNDHRLGNAEVVEIITSKGPVSAQLLRRHQAWLSTAQTKTARHKIARFLREHAMPTVFQGLTPPYSLDASQTSPGDGAGPRPVWLRVQCADRPGLLAEVAGVIAKHDYNVQKHKGTSSAASSQFGMEYELQGSQERLSQLCSDLDALRGVKSWAVGCNCPDP